MMKYGCDVQKPPLDGAIDRIILQNLATPNNAQIQIYARFLTVPYVLILRVAYYSKITKVQVVGLNPKIQ